MSKASEKSAAKAAMSRRVEAAMTEAYAEADAAYAAFAESATRTPEGLIIDSYGWAYVSIFKPSYQFRSTLSAINEIVAGYQGEWLVGSFNRNIRSQSITGQEKACVAARDVLSRHFPDEPSFMIGRRLD